MQNFTSLSDLTQGSRALVVDIHSCNHIRRRLQDLGLIRGTEVSCVLKSPLGDPVAYLIRGAVIALRHEDSSCVQVQLCEVNSEIRPIQRSSEIGMEIGMGIEV